MRQLYIAGFHINPAVTIYFWATGWMHAGTAACYNVPTGRRCNMAAFFLKILFPNAADTVYLGTCALGWGVGFWKATFIEYVVTFLFVFTIFATAVDRQAEYPLEVASRSDSVRRMSKDP